MREPWPSRADRDTDTATSRPGTVSLPGHDTDRDGDREAETVWGADVVTGEDPGPPPATPQLPARMQGMRFAENSTRTTQQKIDFAYFAAYSLPDGPWRTLNIIFVYVVAIPGHVFCDFAKWAYFDKLSRFLLAVPVTVFALFCLNHVPLVQWAVPDAFDVSTLWSVPTDTVEVSVPIAPPPPGGVE